MVRPVPPARRRAAAALGAAMIVAVVALAPEAVVLGVLRLAAYATVVAGASLLVARAGAADLAAAAVVAAGAYAGGVATALVGLPALAGLPAGAVAGAGVGALAGAAHGRLGRTLGALVSLAVATAVVAALTAWPAGGGVAGFHAVGLPTPWGARADLVVVGGLLAGALAVAAAGGRHRRASLAAMGVRAPQVVAALGHRPAAATAAVGGLAGAITGAGGVSLASVTGSVVPGAYGLELAAALALAALVGGSAPLGPLAGTGIVWGPSTLWPLVPLVGTAPPLLVAGPLGLAVLAARRGRPLAARPASDRDPPVRAPTGARSPAPPEPERRAGLATDGLEILGRRVDLEVPAGEVVALTGPNGVGKSTLLAAIGGQIDDGGATVLGGRPAPRGARARSEAGLARTWQRPPRLPASDVLAVVAADGPGWRAATWAREILAADLDEPGVLQLVMLAARRPALALLDEPVDVAPDRLAAFTRGLAAAGTAVLVADHRPEVVAAADREVTLGARA